MASGPYGELALDYESRLSWRPFHSDFAYSGCPTWCDLHLRLEWTGETRAGLVGPKSTSFQQQLIDSTAQAAHATQRGRGSRG